MLLGNEGVQEQNATEELLSEASYNAAEVMEIARNSPDFLAALAMPTVFEYYWPQIFRGVWSWLVDLVGKSRHNTQSILELFPRLALGLPRGFGKTTVIKLFILFCILYTDRRFILVMSATAGHANNILSDIADMLDEPNIKAVFGDWREGLEKDTQEVKKFSFRGRVVILAGLGAGGNVRGLNLKNERPDVMIFEDVQKREDAESKVVSENLYRWMLGTAMKAKAPKRCMTIFIGNMYPTPNSILRKLKANSQWTKFIAGGILEDGTSLWEELQPIQQLMSEYLSDLEAGHPEIFHAEVLNDENASVNNLIDFSSLPAYPFQDDDISLGNFIVIDPSNDKANSDAVSLGYFEIHGEAKPCAKEIVDGRFSPGDTIREAIKLCMKHNCSLVVVEANAYQYSLLYWSDFICKQLGIEGIEFVPIYSGKLAKNTRILNMFKEYVAGEIFVHDNCRTQVHMQISDFRPLKTDNVDGILDLLTYAPRVVQEFQEYLASQTIIGQQEMREQTDNLASVEELSCF